MEKTQKSIKMKNHTKRNKTEAELADETEDNSKSEENLKRNVLSILNKLTTQKFETLLLQMNNLNIDTENKLYIISYMIYEKAVQEPLFCALYAKLCKYLTLKVVKVPFSTNSNPRKVLPVHSSKSDHTSIEQQSKTFFTTERKYKKNLHKLKPKKFVQYLWFEEDQWSPLNPEGKKQYNRDFLLYMQTQPLCLRKPNLEILDFIEDWIRETMSKDKGPNFHKKIAKICLNEFKLKEIEKEKLKNMQQVTAELSMLQQKEKMYEESRKMRHMQLGRIRFMCEICNFDILANSVINEYIKSFIAKGDEDSLEYLCLMLKITGIKLFRGKWMDNAKKNREDIYFKSIQEIVDKRQISNRIWFMLQDVIDLKENDWVPRRSIDEIIKEYLQKSQSKENNNGAYNRNIGVALPGGESNKDSLQDKS